MINERLLGALAGGRSVIVGSVDARGIASCCRGLAIRPNEEAGTLTIYVPVATAREVVANAATTRKLAVASSMPLDHTTIQIKGTATDIRLAREDEKAFVAERFDAFAGVLEQTGLPRRVSARVGRWPAFAIDLTVEEVYDQTPGPRAGEPLR
ncbi:MAG TPA: hypothetical protein VGE86_07830 [Thermoanaerobaculia bacterium]